MSKTQCRPSTNVKYPSTGKNKMAVVFKGSIRKKAKFTCVEAFFFSLLIKMN